MNLFPQWGRPRKKKVVGVQKKWQVPIFGPFFRSHDHYYLIDHWYSYCLRVETGQANPVNYRLPSNRARGGRGRHSAQSSTAYYPTLVQTRQRWLLYIASSQLRRDPFFPSCTLQLENSPLQIQIRRADLHKAESQIDYLNGKLRKQEEKENKTMWEKEKRKRSTKKENTTDVFKRRRLTRDI